MVIEIDSLLSFWFGSAEDPAEIAREQEALWWKGAAETDRLISERFGALHRRAVAGELEDWTATPRGRLAAIILVDQFSRCLHRRQPGAFAYDPLALRWCLDGLDRGDDAALRPIERVFFYLPLEHSESHADQDRSVAVFERLEAEVAPELRELFAYYTGFARAHRDIVQRFGRFPHRNAILGRVSTPEESEFLQLPGSSF